MIAGIFLWSSAVQQTLFDLDSSSGRTCREYSQRTTMLSAASWRDLSAHLPPSFRPSDGAARAWLMDPSDQSPTASWMPNISAWPNGASVCSLSQVLETKPIPPKYFLSGKACAGILRRAERRGKVLPTTLRLALEQVAVDLSGLEKPEGKTLSLPCASTLAE